MDFENKEFEGIYYSRFIASWIKVNPGRIYRTEFVNWLKQISVNGKTMDDETADQIYHLAANGKLELEENAKHFRRNKIEAE